MSLLNLVMWRTQGVVPLLVEGQWVGVKVAHHEEGLPWVVGLVLVAALEMVQAVTDRIDFAMHTDWAQQAADLRHPWAEALRKLGHLAQMVLVRIGSKEEHQRVGDYKVTQFSGEMTMVVAQHLMRTAEERMCWLRMMTVLVAAVTLMVGRRWVVRLREGELGQL